MAVTTKKYSFWWEGSPPDFAFQPQLSVHYDIVIIGAGYAGISTAYWLVRLAKDKKKRLRILILDKAPHAAFKASGRMTGSVYLGSNKPPTEVADVIGEAKAEKLYHYGEANNRLLRELMDRGLDCGAEFNGGLRMASNAKEVVELEGSYDLLTKWGFIPAQFDHKASQHLLVAPQTKSSLFIPDEGMFDPFSYCNKLAILLRKNHVQIVYGADVVGVDETDAGPIVQLDNGHRINAGKVVHTTTHTVECERVEDDVRYCREHVLRTEELSDNNEDVALPLMPIEINRGTDSIRIHERSAIMAGGKGGLTRDPELDSRNDNWFNRRVLDHLDKTMMTHFPVANHLEISHTWTYIETTTSDGLPLMGALPNKVGQFVNIAHGRNKFGLAFLGSKNIAEKVLRIKMQDSNFKIFDPKRLTRGE